MISRHHLKNIRIEDIYLKCFLAEFIGTMIFISFVLASVAQFKFSGREDFLSLGVSHCFGLTMGIVVAGKISGFFLISSLIL